MSGGAWPDDGATPARLPGNGARPMRAAIVGTGYIAGVHARLIK